MGLYLAIFDDDKELEGIEIGTYADFSIFRNTVIQNLENGSVGSRFPTLILHSDCEGLWTPIEAALLENELRIIGSEFHSLPPVYPTDDWKKEAIKIYGISLRTLYDCFFDVDGEPLLDRLTKLAELSQQKNLPILFQ